MNGLLPPVVPLFCTQPSSQTWFLLLSFRNVITACSCFPPDNLMGFENEAEGEPLKTGPHVSRHTQKRLYWEKRVSFLQWCKIYVQLKPIYLRKHHQVALWKDTSKLFLTRCCAIRIFRWTCLIRNICEVLILCKYVGEYAVGFPVSGHAVRKAYEALLKNCSYVLVPILIRNDKVLDWAEWHSADHCQSAGWMKAQILFTWEINSGVFKYHHSDRSSANISRQLN